mmetsp:Transcript_20587/g.52331  ORF Transcript_20587/g.52331 Transcript_20587/m.52331 type:complete len:912 (-) Transcript_20587:56-2791(-)
MAAPQTEANTVVGGSSDARAAMASNRQLSGDVSPASEAQPQEQTERKGRFRITKYTQAPAASAQAPVPALEAIQTAVPARPVQVPGTPVLGAVGPGAHLGSEPEWKSAGLSPTTVAPRAVDGQPTRAVEVRPVVDLSRSIPEPRFGTEPTQPRDGEQVPVRTEWPGPCEKQSLAARAAEQAAKPAETARGPGDAGQSRGVQPALRLTSAPAPVVVTPPRAGNHSTAAAPDREDVPASDEVAARAPTQQPLRDSVPVSFGSDPSGIDQLPGRPALEVVCQQAAQGAAATGALGSPQSAVGQTGHASSVGAVVPTAGGASAVGRPDTPLSETHWTDDTRVGDRVGQPAGASNSQLVGNVLPRTPMGTSAVGGLQSQYRKPESARPQSQISAEAQDLRKVPGPPASAVGSERSCTSAVAHEAPSKAPSAGSSGRSTFSGGRKWRVGRFTVEAMDDADGAPTQQAKEEFVDTTPTAADGSTHAALQKVDMPHMLQRFFETQQGLLNLTLQNMQESMQQMVASTLNGNGVPVQAAKRSVTPTSTASFNPSARSETKGPSSEISAPTSAQIVESDPSEVLDRDLHQIPAGRDDLRTASHKPQWDTGDTITVKAIWADLGAKVDALVEHNNELQIENAKLRQENKELRRYINNLQQFIGRAGLDLNEVPNSAAKPVASTTKPQVPPVTGHKGQNPLSQYAAKDSGLHGTPRQVTPRQALPHSQSKVATPRDSVPWQSTPSGQAAPRAGSQVAGAAPPLRTGAGHGSSLPAAAVSERSSAPPPRATTQRTHAPGSPVQPATPRTHATAPRARDDTQAAAPRPKEEPPSGPGRQREEAHATPTRQSKPRQDSGLVGKAHEATKSRLEGGAAVSGRVQDHLNMRAPDGAKPELAPRPAATRDLGVARRDESSVDPTGRPDS